LEEKYRRLDGQIIQLAAAGTFIQKPVTLNEIFHKIADILSS